MVSDQVRHCPSLRHVGSFPTVVLQITLEIPEWSLLLDAFTTSSRIEHVFILKTTINYHGPKLLTLRKVSVASDQSHPQLGELVQRVSGKGVVLRIRRVFLSPFGF
ncbi:hypothetical protein AVEN_121937-1 [Araneus ventricosus]|uniref:Uncharacterized protein n=1 Tax=Araneus ventricosus TaxID=182803 RepID=A0A4Y2P983_ARAVE|nr:hypothetical protein AVEN_121937-1 [Araneus ventricosus]